MIKCNVCNENLDKKVYETLSRTSITSICTTVEYPTEVYYCTCCGHIQTLELPDELSYYDETYNFLAESEEEDQIYIVENGQAIYRTQHQVATLLSKLKLAKGVRILDYGCAKSSTMRELTRLDLSISPYLFDISERYIPYWKEFIENGKWATYQVPDSWTSQFDVVTSFFSLEHISKLGGTLQKIKRVLVEDGCLYAIVPNTQTNPADLIVVDHPNHFTRDSLEKLLFDNGFTVQEIDEHSHRGAYVVIAKNKSPVNPPAELSADLEKNITSIGNFWKSAAEKVREFEISKAMDHPSAIYGAGFYGSFLAANLNSLKQVRCFIDQNQFLQGKSIMQRLIVHPRELPSEVSVIYVALNPRHSKEIIRDIKVFSGKKIHYFYI